jgi:hypothetical protein
MTSEAAAVAVGVSVPVGSRWFRHGGGMSPISLAEPTGRYLSFAEREEIALLKAQDHRVREIARRVGRDPSTISRELRRNAATRGGRLEYRASVAQWKAETAAKRPKKAKLITNPGLRHYVQERLAANCVVRTAAWSPARRLCGRDATSHGVRTVAGRRRGARNKSRTGCRLTSPMMSPCGSATRRSTKRSTSRAAAPLSASWWRACAPGGRCEFLGLGPATRPAAANIEYKVMRLDDGVSFVHVSTADTADGSNPLPALAAFREFSKDAGARVATPPHPTAADIVGSYTPAPAQ